MSIEAVYARQVNGRCQRSERAAFIDHAHHSIAGRLCLFKQIKSRSCRRPCDAGRRVQGADDDHGAGDSALPETPIMHCSNWSLVPRLLLIGSERSE